MKTLKMVHINKVFLKKGKMINNLVLISDAQQRHSALHIYVSILAQHSPPIQAEEEAYFLSAHFCAIEIILCIIKAKPTNGYVEIDENMRS